MTRAPLLFCASVPLWAASALALAACGRPAAAPPASPQARAPSVTVAPVAQEPMKGGLEASGLLVSREEAAVNTELNGYRVAQVFVDQGARVGEGQPLARLDDTLLRAQIAQQQAMVTQQKVAAERSAEEARRVQGLDNAGVLPQEQIAERRLGARSAQATVAAAQAALNDLLTRQKLMTVRAPVGGVVLSRAVRPGDVASPGQTMFRLARGGVVEVNAELAETDLGKVRPGSSAQVSLPNGATVGGVVRLVSPEVDAQTKLGRVRVTLPVRDDLRPGGFARVSFTGADHLAVTAPESAVRFDADGASVMVLGGGDRVRRVPVRTGLRQGGRVELLSGPRPGEKVLLGGGAFVLDGDVVRPVDAASGNERAGAKPS